MRKIEISTYDSQELYMTLESAKDIVSAQALGLPICDKTADEYFCDLDIEVKVENEDGTESYDYRRPTEAEVLGYALDALGKGHEIVASIGMRDAGIVAYKECAAMLTANIGMGDRVVFIKDNAIYSGVVCRVQLSVSSGDHRTTKAIECDYVRAWGDKENVFVSFVEKMEEAGDFRDMVGIKDCVPIILPQKAKPFYIELPINKVFRTANECAESLFGEI